MASSSTHRDPRSIITPDAFEVASGLLGTPLAAPRRRLLAMLIDLAVIGLITLATRERSLIVGVVAAVFFMRAGWKRTKVRGSVFGRAMRFSVGCLGVFIGIVTAALWATFGIDFGGAGTGPSADVNFTVTGTGGAGETLASLIALGMSTDLEDAETLEEAEEAALEIIAGAEEAGVQPAELRAFLLAETSDDLPREQAEALYDRLLGLSDAIPGAGDGGSAEAAVGSLSIGEALTAYAELVRANADDDESVARRGALQMRLAAELGADTLAALSARIADLERANRTQQRSLDRTSAALEEASSGGAFGWLRDWLDDLGFGGLWASLYLTVFLSWWNGQTVGKRAMRIRVVRLDGEPINWWVAFERAGGYAAGFATGLLGFAQVWWDSNRQMIHDRIVGTVVVMDGAKKVIDWESAL
jgi:uncharacterized RDD family membrane protein YckC